jgi:hypothetical protein
MREATSSAIVGGVFEEQRNLLRSRLWTLHVAGFNLDGTHTCPRVRVWDRMLASVCAQEE